jgi:hypothetical protein
MLSIKDIVLFLFFVKFLVIYYEMGFLSFPSFGVKIRRSKAVLLRMMQRQEQKFLASAGD